MKITLAFALSILVLISGCSSTPVSNRSALILVPFSQEVSLGEKSYDEILGKEKLSTDKDLTAVVERVGLRIARVSDMPKLKWEVSLIESDQQNAFALPGGKIAVYTGLIPVCENEAGLAAVLAHEVAHVIARHGAQRMSNDLIMDTALIGAAVGVGTSENSKLILGALGLGAYYGISLPYSRAHEAEADEIGLTYMAEAGYDPDEAERFWKRFSAKKSGAQAPEFLSTHPSDATRINKIRKLLPNARSKYKSAKTQYGLGEKL